MSQSLSDIVYAPHTVLRYYPLDGSPHYTAIVLNEKGQLLEVKRGAVKEKREFEDIDSWLESLPDEPTVDDLLVNVKTESASDTEKESESHEEKQEKQKKEKKEKVVKEKPLKLKLIPYSKRVYSTHWTIHIHTIIKEANPVLLKQKEVIEAFNGLVDVLLENQFHVQGIVHPTHSKYSKGINIDENPEDHPLKGMCFIGLNSVSYSESLGRHIIKHSYYYYDTLHQTSGKSEDKQKTKEIQDQIVKAYRKLFVLIRSDVLPYIQRKDAEIQMKTRSKKLERLVNRMERLEEIYEKELQRRLQAIEQFKASHQQQMDTFRQMIGTI